MIYCRKNANHYDFSANLNFFYGRVLCSDVEHIDAIMRLFNWFNSDITIMKKFEIFRELSKRDADNRSEQIRLTKWRRSTCSTQRCYKPSIGKET